MITNMRKHLSKNRKIINLYSLGLSVLFTFSGGLSNASSASDTSGASGDLNASGIVQEVTSRVITIRNEDQVMRFQVNKGIDEHLNTIKEGDYVRIEYLLVATGLKVLNSHNYGRQLPGQVPPNKQDKPDSQDKPDNQDKQEQQKRILDDRAFYPA